MPGNSARRPTPRGYGAGQRDNFELGERGGRIDYRSLLSDDKWCAQSPLHAILSRCVNFNIGRKSIAVVGKCFADHTQAAACAQLLILNKLGHRLVAIDETFIPCLLYTSDAADDLLCVDLGGRRLINKK